MQIEGIRSVSAPYMTAAAPSSVAAAERSIPEQPVRSSQLPFISPVLQYDSDAAVAVLLFRDGGSGDVETQYPSKRVVREYQLRGREIGGAEPSSSGEDRGAGNPLLSLARSGISTISGSPAPGFGTSGGSVSPTVAASPTVAIAGGGSVAASVNFVA